MFIYISLLDQLLYIPQFSSLHVFSSFFYLSFFSDRPPLSLSFFLSFFLLLSLSVSLFLSLSLSLSLLWLSSSISFLLSLSISLFLPLNSFSLLSLSLHLSPKIIVFVLSIFQLSMLHNFSVCWLLSKYSLKWFYSLNRCNHNIIQPKYWTNYNLSVWSPKDIKSVFVHVCEFKPFWPLSWECFIKLCIKLRMILERTWIWRAKWDVQSFSWHFNRVCLYLP